MTPGNYGRGFVKIRKKNPLRKVLYKTLPELVSAIFCYGRVKSGKTTTLMSIAQGYHDHPQRKYKIFDIWGGSRNEHLYWTLPSNKTKFWKNAKKVLRLDGEGPKQYKVKLIYPLLGDLPKKLPYNPPHVLSSIFTIPIRDLLVTDMSLVVGGISTTSEGQWNDFLYASSKKDSLPILNNKVKDKVAQSSSIYRSILSPLIREDFLQNDLCSLNLDFKEELKDKETISVLCLDFVKEEYRLFVLGYFLRKISEILDSSGRKNKSIFIMREASEFFRVTDQSIVHERKKIFKNFLSMIIRMGRRGMHLFLDTQSPSETRGLVDGQQDLTFFGRLPSESDRREATEQLKRDDLVTQKQINALGTMNPGQFLVCPSGKPAFSQYFLLPRTRFWEEGDGNFYNNVWRKEVNRWCNFESELTELRDNRKIEEKRLREEKEIRDAARRLKEKDDAILKEENKAIENEEMKKLRKGMSDKYRKEARDERKIEDSPPRRRSTQQRKQPLVVEEKHLNKDNSLESHKVSDDKKPKEFAWAEPDFKF